MMKSGNLPPDVFSQKTECYFKKNFRTRRFDVFDSHTNASTLKFFRLLSH